MNKKTKIIATIGPASENEEIICRLLESGVNVFRFNLKHNNFEWHEDVVKRVRAAAKSLNTNVGVMVDLQGPEIRLETPETNDVEVADGELIYIAGKFIEGEKGIIINPDQVIDSIDEGDTLFIDDGDLELKVVSKENRVVRARAERDYVIKNRKSLNVPLKTLDLPLFSKRDLEAIEILPNIDPDFVALSFVRSKNDIFELREKLQKKNVNAKIVAKIENAAALHNLEEIIQATDAVMVARGDLGVEVPLRELAFWQKKMIDLCRKNNRPVIVATQMMQSMITNYNPTRAEATDVANAVFDGTDALMLSEETAGGKYPVKVAKEMAKIAEFCENHGEVKNIEMDLNDTTEVMSQAAVNIVRSSNSFPIKAIVVFTKSGNTARVISKYRLGIPVVAVTNDTDAVRSLALSYGVLPLLKKLEDGQFQIENPIFKELIGIESIEKGDNVLVIHGNNWISSGSTSNISLVTI